MKKKLILIAAGFLLLASLYLTSDLMLPGHPFYYSKMQHQDYITLAKDPFNSGNAPFCWRLFTPVIAHLLPVQYEYTFFTITALALLFTGLFIFLILKHYKFSNEYSFYGVILFYGMVWAVRFNLIEFWYPDALLFLLISVAIYAALKRNKLLFFLAMLVGVTVKETMLIAIPLWYSINQMGKSPGKLDWKNIKETVILSLPAVALLILIRTLLPSSNNYNMINDLYYFSLYRLEAIIGLSSSLNYTVVENQPQWLTASINIYRISFGAFGGLLFLVLVDIKKLKQVFHQYWIFILLVIFQLFLAYDSERLLVTAFLPLIIFTLIILQYAEQELGILKVIIRLFLILYFGVQLIATQSYYHETYYAAFYQNLIAIFFTGYLFVKKFKVKSNLQPN
jgi:hypothetical protein